MDLSDVQSWTDAYVRAWETSHPQAVGDLFAEHARYYTHPFRDPWEGREAIVRNWIEHPDPPGSWKASYRALAMNGTTAVIRGTTQYLKDDGSIDREYANIYVVEFDEDGRATEFTEFFMERNPPDRA